MEYSKFTWCSRTFSSIRRIFGTKYDFTFKRISKVLKILFIFLFEFFLFVRNIDGIKDCFKPILCSINADQPLNDVFTQVYAYTIKKSRSVAPLTPRIVILGPTGSGRKTIAMQISRKYDIPIGKKYSSILSSMQRLSERENTGFDLRLLF
jgi:hypothetical protein